MVHRLESWHPSPPAEQNPSEDERALIEKQAEVTREVRRKNEKIQNLQQPRVNDEKPLAPEDLLIQETDSHVLVRPVLEDHMSFLEEQDVIESKKERYSIHDLFNYISFNKKGGRDVLGTGKEFIPDDIRMILQGISEEEARAEFSRMEKKNDPQLNNYKRKLKRLLVAAVPLSEESTGTPDYQNDPIYQKIKSLNHTINTLPLLRKSGAIPPPLPPRRAPEKMVFNQEELQRKYALHELLNAEHFHTTLDSMIKEGTLADNPQAFIDYIHSLSEEERRKFEGTRTSLSELVQYLSQSITEHPVETSLPSKTTDREKSPPVLQFYKDLKEPDENEGLGMKNPKDKTKFDRTPVYKMSESSVIAPMQVEATRIYNTRVTPVLVPNQKQELKKYDWESRPQTGYGRFSNEMASLLRTGILTGKEQLIVRNDQRFEEILARNSGDGLSTEALLQKSLTERLQGLEVINTQQDIQRGFTKKFVRFFTREKTPEEKLEAEYQKILDRLTK